MQLLEFFCYPFVFVWHFKISESPSMDLYSTEIFIVFSSAKYLLALLQWLRNASAVFEDCLLSLLV